MAGHLLSNLDAAAIRQIISNARSTEHLAADLVLIPVSASLWRNIGPFLSLSRMVLEIQSPVTYWMLAWQPALALLERCRCRILAGFQLPGG
jgi:hypothetical protein